MVGAGFVGGRGLEATPPRRVVSLVPSLTELLAALGLDAETVGLTKFCVRPDDWRKRKRVVGGTKTVHVDRVAALAPDLVLAVKEETPRDVAEAVATFAPVWVGDVQTVAGALSVIRDVGALTGRWPAADALAARIETRFDALARETAAAPPLRAVCLIWRDPWMAVGGDTFASDVLARAGIENALGDRDRYPTLTDDDLRALAPEAVVLPSEPFPFAQRHAAEVRALLPDARVALADGQALTWYGPRMLEAPDALRSLRSALGT